MTAPTRLALGDWVAFDNETQQIVGFTDTGVRLRSETGRMQIILLAALLAAPDFRTIPDSAPANAGEVRTEAVDREAILLGLPAGERARVEELEEHLHQVETGFPTGTAADHSEPDPAYDPAQTTLTARIDTKAAELGLTSRRLWQLRRAWQHDGLVGLADRRKTRPCAPLAPVDPRIITAIREQAAADRLESSATIGNRFHRRTQNRLDAQHGLGEVVLPGKDRFRRIVHQALVGPRPDDPATLRIRTANQPDRTFGKATATRPGEVVMMDTTGLDVIAYDPDTDDTVPVELTVALDLATRSLLAWRLTPRGTKSVDIGLLLADVMTPEPMRPHWPDALRFASLRIPHERILTVDQRLAHAAARPVIYPETLLFDHGKPYKSEVVTRACRRLGISIQDARMFTPTDKPHVERIFATINRQFCEHLAGYKGSDITHRGLHAEDTARWSIDDIAELFAEYAVGIYQRRHHQGLILHGFPDLRASPNEAYAMAIAAAGYVDCPNDPDLYYELLPIADGKGRTIQPAGVRIGYLTYNADILYRYRRTRSPYPDGLWPIRRDPRNLLHAYFHDPDDGRWHVLRWTHALDVHQPFTDVTIREARRLVSQRGRNPTDQDDVATALLDLQNRADDPATWTRTARSRTARDSHRGRAAHRDAQRAGPPADDPQPPTDLPPASADEFDLDEIPAAETWKPRLPRIP
ncbi:Mu transposase, C-terminal [Frankia sp. EI5c]|uniref:DDE-type integrase/transposase/recombinase n=1 Tax=Frankia sp. EI5c TaxID=683316 RepID=UPI0007C40C89|nr:DDE-type integrase/transposase/recombinase [Frankia sp. EI5c]OAA17987.1 Mu transposase, C-terminal [Frankia sp. EI5c]OAA20771.1 Mu transposase, C-terminal [Frankia sp. EI5c]